MNGDSLNYDRTMLQSRRRLLLFCLRGAKSNGKQKIIRLAMVMARWTLSTISVVGGQQVYQPTHTPATPRVSAAKISCVYQLLFGAGWKYLASNCKIVLAVSAVAVVPKTAISPIHHVPSF